MNASRLMAMAVTTCAAGLSLAACSAGITSASPPASRSPATSHAASSPAMSHAASSPAAAASHTSPVSASPADTVSVDVRIGSFPIPHGAKVIANLVCDRQVIINLTSVTPAQASSFYLAALPRAGYRITGNISTASGGTFTEIDFTGHGYKGTMTAGPDSGALPSKSPSDAPPPSNATRNLVAIFLTPPGTTGCATSPATP